MMIACVRIPLAPCVGLPSGNISRNLRDKMMKKMRAMPEGQGGGGGGGTRLREPPTSCCRRRLLVVILLFILANHLGSHCPIHVRCDDAEAAALLSFLECFQEGSPARAALSQTWIPRPDIGGGRGGGSPCRWPGVGCDPEGHVSSLLLVPPVLPPGSGSHCVVATHLQLSSLPHLTSLALPSLNLTGPLPELSSAHRRLALLDLSYNNLSGPIPASFFARLPGLTSLSLQFNQLSGPIPDAVALSPRLAVLRLHDNRLAGGIPAAIGRLGRLRLFRAGGNPSLAGPIPPEIGNCSALADVGLAFTAVSGPLPASLGRLPALARLRLFSAKLSGAIPAALANCSRLEELFLFDNRLGGALPPGLGRLPRLRLLYLWGNELSGAIPPELGRLASLRVLELSQNRLGGAVPAALGGLSSASGIYLSINALSGPIPRELANCSRLTELQLDRNELSGSIPPQLGNLSRLALLFLWNNSLSGAIPDSFGGCAALQFLDFSWNRLSGALPAALFGLRALYKLLLVGNKLSGPIPGAIGGCQSLYRLRLGRNRLSGELPPEIGRLRNLTFLDISGNSIGGTIPGEIAGCESLQLLDASRNALVGGLPPELGRLSGSLQLLDLSFNRLSGPLPAAVVGRLLQLTKLSLGGNGFSGSIPPEIAALRKLAALDLSSNRLSGAIPGSLGSLGRTLSVALNVCCNALSGGVPPEFAQLLALGQLDLSHNNLSGRLDALARMESLVTLNISYNRFTGPLPDTFLFRSMPTSTYAGIPGLCGGGGDSPCFGPTPGEAAAAAGDRSTTTTGGQSEAGRSPSPSSMARSRRVVIVSSVIGSIGLMLAAAAATLILYLQSASMGKNLRSGGGGTSSCGWPASVIAGKNRGTAEPWELTPFQRLNFTLEEVLERMGDEANVVGRGSSGVVYKAELRGGEVVAVKKVMAAREEASGGSPTVPASSGLGFQRPIQRRFGRRRDSFAAEVDALRHVRHTNIVRLLGFATSRLRRESLLLYDYMPNGSLGEYMHERKRPLDWDARYGILLGAAQGLAYLHHDCAPPILHRDVKPNNILLGPRLEPYLADFGLAKFADWAAAAAATIGGITDCGDSRPPHRRHHLHPPDSAATTSVVAGSYGYIAPEYAYTLASTAKGDVYSYGVVMLEVLTGKRAVADRDDEGGAGHIIDWVLEMMHRQQHDAAEILDARLRGMPDPFVREMLQALRLALECVHPAPDQRPTMRHVVALLVAIRHHHDHAADLQSKLERILSSSSDPPATPIQ